MDLYFCFRKAYCKLNICYRFPVRIIIKFLYPFRRYINNKSKLGSLVSSLLKMEEIYRNE